MEGGKKERLLQIFGHWTDMVTDLIKATPEVDVLRRDIFDRAPVLKWTSGRVALLGDSAHAMQPNLGQGGCMAIEDGYQLAKDLGEAAKLADAYGTEFNPCVTLQVCSCSDMPRWSSIVLHAVLSTAGSSSSSVS